MNKSSIDYLDYVWNPIVGCLHGCPYCFAEAQSHRFSGDVRLNKSALDYTVDENGVYVLEKPPTGRGGAVLKNPFGFAPTLFNYRFEGHYCKPIMVKQPSTFGIVFDGDLFGKWVSDEIIRRVFEVCAAAPQHRYLFLTKNPKRYADLYEEKDLPQGTNYWFGFTQTGIDVLSGGEDYEFQCANIFVSIEPLRACGWSVLDYLGWENSEFDRPSWVIIGAETGNRKEKIVPKREWVENIVEACRATDVPVFMKSNLAAVWGEDLIQEYPWEVKS